MPNRSTELWRAVFVGFSLVSTPWRLRCDGRCIGVMHLAYIENITDDKAIAGVYYRTLLRGSILKFSHIYKI